MSKINMFLRAALEEAATVGPDAIHHTDPVAPKPGVGEAEFDDGAKEEGEFGEEHPVAEHDEIDAVAESQEYTLAIEHLQSTIGRYMRVGAALEEIEEAVQSKLDNGEEMTATDTALVTTAIDAAGVGEPLAEGVALESFAFSGRVATESFMEDVANRAKKVWEAVSKFVKRVFEETRNRMKRFADFFRSMPKIVEKLEKEIEQTQGFEGKNFADSKRESSIQKKFFSPSSVKSPLDVVRNSTTEFDTLIKLVDNKLQGDAQALQRSWATDSPEQVVSSMNKVLATLKNVLSQGATNAKHSAVIMEVNLPERFTLDGANGMAGTKATYNDGKQEFDASLKIASSKDLTVLKEVALRADRVITSVIDDLFDDTFILPYKGRSSSSSDADAKQMRDLTAKYRSLLQIVVDVWCGVVFGAAQGLFYNTFVATGWVRASIAEARAMRSAEK